MTKCRPRKIDDPKTINQISTYASCDANKAFELEVMLDGKQSYLWFGIGGICCGVYSGAKLFALAEKLLIARGKLSPYSLRKLVRKMGND